MRADTGMACQQEDALDNRSGIGKQDHSVAEQENEQSSLHRLQ